MGEHNPSSLHKRHPFNCCNKKFSAIDRERERELLLPSTWGFVSTKRIMTEAWQRDRALMIDHDHPRSSTPLSPRCSAQLVASAEFSICYEWGIEFFAALLADE
ncbi:hypothetical protein VTL71DRAFT_1300 [Oculimacula yallundae]|uniref:Uncharacterized protein n=1 Tax=Oculimacula yallundae TaxID=86028 RepID=A0ABR4CBN0_9HELO